MEKGPKVRIVGGASAEEKEQAKKEIEQAFFNHFDSLSPQEKEMVEKFEYPKSEKEVALIDFANKETSRLMQEAGLESYDIPKENLHIVPQEFVPDGTRGRVGATAATKQGILLNSKYVRDNLVCFGEVILHEMLHLKTHLSIEAEEIENTMYRHGVSVYASQKNRYRGALQEKFVGLHEGIVAEAEKRLLPKLLEQPELTGEKEWLFSDEAKTLKKDIAEKNNIPEGDFVWVGRNGENDWRIVPYPEQRIVLKYVCDEIQKQFPEQYKNTDDVYKIFLDANFTGRLLPIARLVEGTFGKGGFRFLGDMDESQEDGILFLELLKKARIESTANYV